MKSDALRLFCTHGAQPGSFGEDRPALAAHVVVANLTLAGGSGQPTERLQASATAALTVLPAAALGPFPLHIQQLALQTPETHNANMKRMNPVG